MICLVISCYFTCSSYILLGGSNSLYTWTQIIDILELLDPNTAPFLEVRLAMHYTMYGSAAVTGAPSDLQKIFADDRAGRRNRVQRLGKVSSNLKKQIEGAGWVRKIH